MAATYGGAIVIAGYGDIFGRIPWEQFIGLRLNIGRAQTRQAYGVLSAVSAVLKDSISPEWFAAIADADDEAKAMHSHYQAMSEASQEREDFR